MVAGFKVCEEVLYYTGVRVSDPSPAISVGKHNVLSCVARSLALRSFPVREFRIMSKGYITSELILNLWNLRKFSPDNYVSIRSDWSQT
jgi:hypothetical protein